MNNRITIKQRIRRITSKIRDKITGKPDICTMQEAINDCKRAWAKSGHPYPMPKKN